MRVIARRPVPRNVQEAIRDTVAGVAGVETINGMVATFVGSTAIRVELDLDLAEGPTTLEIEALLDTVQRQASSIEPRVASVTVDLNSPAAIRAKATRGAARANNEPPPHGCDSGLPG